MKKVSLKDIANALNVSRTLVSIVLNGQGDKHGISKKTQERVLKKAKALNYVPNSVARGLRTGKSNTIGLIVSDISNSFYAQIAKKIESEVSSSGYNLIFCSSDEDSAKEEQLISMLVSRQIDGLIVAPTMKSSDLYKRLIKNGLPLVLFDRFYEDMEANYVLLKNFEGAYDGIKHLIEFGHKCISLFTISPSYISSIKERELGYRAAYKDSDLKVDESLINNIRFDALETDVRIALKEILSRQHVTAIFALNNSIAKTCLMLIKNEFPALSHLSILSFDDIDVFAFSHPTISAIRQPIDEIASSSVHLLMNLVENGYGEFFRKKLSAELIVRSSSKFLQNV